MAETPHLIAFPTSRPLPCSDRHGLLDRELPTLANGRATKPGGLEELVELVDTSFLAARHDEHVHVHQCWQPRPPQFTDEVVDNDDAPPFQGSTAILQDPDAALVVPVVQDVLEQVQV